MTHGISDGATSDAIVALTAAEAGCTVVTLDLRARRIYSALKVDYRLLA